MRKWGLKLGILLLMLFVLSGCMSQSGEDFYALPQLPEDYLALQKTIDRVMNTIGAEYAAPSSGDNMQTIQLQDLDGDGARESAVAFFRVANAEKPLKIYVFRQNTTSGEYEVAWTIEGDGTGIYSVAFENLGGKNSKEIVVCWQISAKVQSLTAYSLQSGGNVTELMRSGYTKHAVVDLDRDNEKEILLVQLDTAENNSRVEMYDYDNGIMLLTSAVPLSLNITEIKAAKVGSLVGEINLPPALFVSSDFGENGGRITDIIAVREEGLVNLTLDQTIGMSTSTVRYYKDFNDANGLDINGDGVTELPVSESLPPATETSSQMHLLHWYQYDLEGAATRVYTTYHCYDDSWYLVLPEDWLGQVTVARRDQSASASVSERAVSFYHFDPETGETEEFLTIYRLSGTNRNYRSTVDDRFVIFESSDVVYSAKFRNSQWNCGLDDDALRERFNRIKVSWSDED